MGRLVPSSSPLWLLRWPRAPDARPLGGVAHVPRSGRLRIAMSASGPAALARGRASGLQTGAGHQSIIVLLGGSVWVGPASSCEQRHLASVARMSADKKTI